MGPAFQPVVLYLKANDICIIKCFYLSTGGSEGLFAQKTLEITDDILSTYKNQGGYDLLGRTKDQIRTTGQVNAALHCMQRSEIGWPCYHWRSYFKYRCRSASRNICRAKSPTKVVGVPVTLNGDLKNQFVETNVGFDTICKWCLILSFGKLSQFPAHQHVCTVCSFCREGNKFINFLIHDIQ
ncbi:pyrophosphate-fructose-6-phosphate-phosphotransferase alpha1 [Populus alba x Populus x berolinensis]|nr:pyrophosphate-fructose-6-phosphate-phosphotransferase alpha1 [Populus alba x Populus x berolinensis]